MKRIIIIIITVFTFGATVFAQSGGAPVIDITNIVTSIENAANSVAATEGTMNQIINLGNKVGDFEKKFSDFMGEDGTGGKALNFLRQTGELQRLTTRMNQLYDEIADMKKVALDMEAGGYDLWAVNAYLNRIAYFEQLSLQAYNLCKDILGTTGMTKASQLDAIIKANNELLLSMIELEEETDIFFATVDGFDAGKDLAALSRITKKSDFDAAVERELGGEESKSFAHSLIGLISWIIGILALGLVAYGALLTLRAGSQARAGGGNPGALVYYRIAAGAIVVFGILQWLDTVVL